MEYKVIENLSFSEYLEIDALNQSTLKQVKKSLAHAKAASKSSTKKPTAAMALGSAIHTRLLEPTLFSDHYAVWNGGSKVKEKTAWKEFKARNSGKIILPEDDLGTILGIEASVRQLPVWDHINDSRAKKEVSLVWEKVSHKCKARLDCLIPGVAIIDIKTTKDASAENFRWDAGKYGYHNQAAWYCEAATSCGLGEHLYFILAIEKEPPFGAALYLISPAHVVMAGEQNDLLFYAWSKASEFDEFPCYPREAQTIEIPERYL